MLAARDGDESVRLFHERRSEIDAALLDLTMPGRSGEEVFHELRRLRPDLPVVFSSGYSAQALNGTLATDAGFVQKPYRLAELLDAVHGALAS